MRHRKKRNVLTLANARRLRTHRDGVPAIANWFHLEIILTFKSLQRKKRVFFHNHPRDTWSHLNDGDGNGAAVRRNGTKNTCNEIFVVNTIFFYESDVKVILLMATKCIAIAPVFFLLTRSHLVSPPKMFSFWIIISAIWIYIQDTYTNPYDLLDLFGFRRWFLFSFGDVGRNVKLLIARKLCLCFRELYLITTICSPGPICCL